jgi:hypothetical protein
MISNPALHAEPRHQVSSWIVPRGNASIFDWLEQTGRFIQGEVGGPEWSIQDDEDLLMDPILTLSDEDDDLED